METDNKISARIVGDSLSPQGHRITTMELVMPRYILAEFNTHRMFSRNSASSRAIPFEKMVKSVTENPFIPIAWQKHHKGMQGTEYLEGQEIKRFAPATWLRARDYAVQQATLLHQNVGITKQLANRLLEPFMYHKVLVTATEWENFFELRSPQYDIESVLPNIKFPIRFHKSWKDLFTHVQLNLFDNGLSKKDIKILDRLFDMTSTERLTHNKGQGEIHIMDLAEKMWDAMNESIPKQLKAGEWHIPYESEIFRNFEYNKIESLMDTPSEEIIMNRVKISTGKAARASYISFGDEKEVSYETLIGIHDKMLEARPFHASPFEHCAQTMTDKEYEGYMKGIPENRSSGLYILTEDMKGWSRNFRGFKQYREIIEIEYEKNNL